MMKWIDRMPLFPLLAVAIFMAILPIQGTPHLVEKLTMLRDGVLTQPIDIFDLFMHGTPALLLSIRLLREFALGIKAEEKEDAADKK